MGTALGTSSTAAAARVALGLRVVRTERGDLAHAHGVRRGDVVTHVNGVSARTARATTELIDTATARAATSCCR